MRRDILDDPYIYGAVGHEAKRRCQICGKDVICIVVRRLTLPEGIKVADTIMRDQWDQAAPQPCIGINCGCYARFHRQIAHIRDSMAR